MRLNWEREREGGLGTGCELGGASVWRGAFPVEGDEAVRVMDFEWWSHSE